MWQQPDFDADPAVFAAAVMNGYPGFLSSAWFSANNAGLLRNRLRLLILKAFLEQVRASLSMTCQPRELVGAGVRSCHRKARGSDSPRRLYLGSYIAATSPCQLERPQRISMHCKSQRFSILVHSQSAVPTSEMRTLVEAEAKRLEANILQCASSCLSRTDLSILHNPIYFCMPPIVALLATIPQRRCERSHCFQWWLYSVLAL